MHDYAGYRQLGFVGACEFLPHRGVPADVVRVLHLLAAFAFFAGVGYKTTMGMGQVRQVL